VSRGRQTSRRRLSHGGGLADDIDGVANLGTDTRADHGVVVDDDPDWRVRGRLGGDGGREVNYQFDQGWSARAMVDRMMKISVGSWRDLTKALRREADRRYAD